MNRHPDFQVIQAASVYAVERNFWGEVRPGHAELSYDKKFRVEIPVWGIDESIVFSDEYEALKCGREISIEDRVLVLVWSIPAGMYVQRYDGRPPAGESSGE